MRSFPGKSIIVAEQSLPTRAVARRQLLKTDALSEKGAWVGTDDRPLYCRHGIQEGAVRFSANYLGLVHDGAGSGAWGPE